MPSVRIHLPKTLAQEIFSNASSRCVGSQDHLSPDEAWSNMDEITGRNSRGESGAQTNEHYLSLSYDDVNQVREDPSGQSQSLRTAPFNEEEWPLPPAHNPMYVQLDEEDRLSNASAIPRPLKMSPKPVNAQPSPGINSDFISALPVTSVPPTSMNAEQPQAQSFWRFGRNNTNRMSITPSDMMYPPAGSQEPFSGRYIDMERTLGLKSRQEQAVRAAAVAAATSRIDEPSIVESQNSRQLREPPDAGWLAWSQAWSAFLVVFNCWGFNIASGVFQAYYAVEMLRGTPQWKISWIFSVQLFMIFFLGAPIGFALDAGYFRLCFNGGSILLILAVCLTSFCSQWWSLFLCQGLLAGISQGLVFCSGIVVLMSYFSRNIGVAMSIGAAGSSVGGIVYAATFEQLILSVGFAWTVRYIACIMAITMVIPNLIVRPRTGTFISNCTFDWMALQDNPYLIMVSGLYFVFQGLYVGFIYIVSYGKEVLQLSGNDAVNLLIAMCAANLPGRFVPALISDRYIGPLNTVIPSCILSAIIVFLWITSSTHASLVVIACFYGFTCAGVQTLYAPIIHSYSLANPTSMGLKSGVAFSIISIACLTGPPIAGTLITSTGRNYLGLQIFTGCSLMLGGTLLLVSRVWKNGWTASRA